MTVRRLVGALDSVLDDEAQHTKILMRLQETKGALPFHHDLRGFYSKNHGGLNECAKSEAQKRLERQMLLESGSDNDVMAPKNAAIVDKKFPTKFMPRDPAKADGARLSATSSRSPPFYIAHTHTPPWL